MTKETEDAALEGLRMLAFEVEDLPGEEGCVVVGTAGSVPRAQPTLNRFHG